MSQPQWAFSDGVAFRPAVLGFFLNVVCFIYGAVVLFFFIRRRRYFPVSERFSFMVWVGGAVLLHMIWSNMAVPSVPCALSTIISFLATQAILITYVLRIFDLSFKLHIAQSLSYNGQSSEPPSANWWLLHRKFVNRGYQVKCTIAYALFCVGVAILMFFVDPRMRNSTWCADPPVLNRVNVIILIIWFVVFALVAVSLRASSNDALSFKRELKMTFVGGLLALIPFIIVAVSAGSWEFNGLARVLLYALVISCGFTYPVYLSYKHERLLRADGGNTVLAVEMRTQLLQKIIVSHEEFDVFLAFLRTEFSAENGMFLKAYVAVRANEERTVEDFSRLAIDYIFPNAVGEVNIPHDVRLPIIRLLRGSNSRFSRRSTSQTGAAKPTPEVLIEKLTSAFDAARDEVFRSVINDSLPRFLATSPGAKVRVGLLPASSPAPSGGVRSPHRSSMSVSIAARALRDLIGHSSDDSSGGGSSRSGHSLLHSPTPSHALLPLPSSPVDKRQYSVTSLGPRVVPSTTHNTTGPLLDDTPCSSRRASRHSPVEPAPALDIEKAEPQEKQQHEEEEEEEEAASPTPESTPQKNSPAEHEEV